MIYHLIFLLINPRFYNSEYLTPIVITTDRTIYDVQLLDVEMGTVSGEDTYYFVNDVIFKKKKLTNKEPILIDTEFTEFTPNLIFSYTDANGKEKKVSISMSGNDSSILSSPALLEKGKKPQDSNNPEVRQYGEDVPIGPLEEDEVRQYGEDVPIGPLEEDEVRQYGEDVPIGPQE